MTDNMISFFHKWFKLATFKELLDDMRELIPNVEYGSNNRNVINFGTVRRIEAISFIDKNYDISRAREAIRFMDVIPMEKKESLIEQIKEKALL